MSYKIIVARYNEPIEWLNSEIKQCLFYNKGEKLNIENEILLNNLGRESETYLNYIITNYDNLPDVVVFTQAKISDHRTEGDSINYLLKLKDDALINGKSEPHIIHFQTNNNMCWDKGFNLNNGLYFLQNNYLNNTPIIFEDWFKTYININYPQPFCIYSNGIFAVKKELILNNSVEYYKKLILQVNHHINSTEGHFFERSWYYIFNNTNTNTKKERPKIGITLNLPKELADLFTNGIRQHAIFFYKLLKNIGKYDVFFIFRNDNVIENHLLNEMKFDYVLEENILTSNFDIIFTFGYLFKIETYLITRENGVKHIFYNCGNLYIIDSEHCLFKDTTNSFTTYQRYNLFDECWNLPHHTNTTHYYLKTLLRCNIVEVPYIWSPEFIENEQNKFKTRSGNKSIAIFEPNLSIMKWAFPAVLICENAYRDPTFTDKIKHIYITNTDTKINKSHFTNLVTSLDLKKDSKISIEVRYNSLYFMSKYADIVVSHTWENWLNNLYFDIAWMGWPIVHNGKFCKEVGYYYDEFNYEMGADALKDVILNHDENADEYLLRNRLYMQKYLPTNKALKKHYEDLITNFLSTSKTNTEEK
jgi:hypothetical protein